MTEVAVLPDHLAVFRFVKIVMAAEAAGELHVPAIVRVVSPGDLHGREDVALVEFKPDGENQVCFGGVVIAVESIFAALLHPSQRCSHLAEFLDQVLWLWFDGLGFRLD